MVSIASCLGSLAEALWPLLPNMPVLPGQTVGYFLQACLSQRPVTPRLTHLSPKENLSDINSLLVL